MSTRTDPPVEVHIRGFARLPKETQLALVRLTKCALEAIERGDLDDDQNAAMEPPKRKEFQ